MLEEIAKQDEWTKELLQAAWGVHIKDAADAAVWVRVRIGQKYFRKLVHQRRVALAVHLACHGLRMKLRN